MEHDDIQVWKDGFEDEDVEGREDVDRWPDGEGDPPDDGDV